MKQPNKLLIGSIILNIFFVGFFAGKIWYKGSKKNNSLMHTHVMEKNEMMEFRKEMQERNQKLKQALLIEPFNAKEISKAFDNMQEKLNEHLNAIEFRILKVGPTMAPRERIKLIPHPGGYKEENPIRGRTIRIQHRLIQ